MISLLEQLHSVGYLHCDLKPDNICVGDGINNSTLSEFKLIDFGVSECIHKNPDLMMEPILDEDHREEAASPQKGNLIFASPNSVKNITLSRRDDMISLFYLMLYLQTKQIPFFKQSVPIKEQKKSIIEEKLNTTIPDLCKKFKSIHMIPFA